MVHCVQLAVFLVPKLRHQNASRATQLTNMDGWLRAVITLVQAQHITKEEIVLNIVLLGLMETQAPVNANPAIQNVLFVP